MKELIEKLDLKSQDFILLSGDFTSIIMQEKRKNKAFNPNTFLDEIIYKISQDGTLALPTFSWDFCSKKYFDINKTPGETGFFGNLALKREDFERTKHPIYSFAVYGKFKKELVDLNNLNSFYPGTAFEFFYKKRAKMVIVNKTLNDSFTFAHFVEQKYNVDYRYSKQFDGVYIDKNNNKMQKSYEMYVRRLDLNVQTSLDNLSAIMISNNAMTQTNINDINIKIIDLSLAHDIIRDDILYNNAKNLYKKG